MRATQLSPALGGYDNSGGVAAMQFSSAKNVPAENRLVSGGMALGSRQMVCGCVSWRY